MRNIAAIAGKEIRAYFATPLAYAVIAGFLLLAGYFFFSLLQQFNTLVRQAAMMQGVTPSLNEWVVMPFYQTLEVVLIFFLPVLTARTIAEEKRMGTFELLVTSPLTVNEIVLGKFLGCVLVVGLMLLLSFCFPLVLIIFADPEVKPVLIGFLGINFLAFGFVALGIAVSSFTSSQTVAGVVGLVLLLVFYVLDAPAASFGPRIAEAVKYLAPANHAEAMLKGVLSGRDIVYFVSVALLGLFAAGRALDAERWR